MSVEVKYSTAATAVGGRDGHVSTQDGKLDVIVSTPKELGGPGLGTNPERLFAAGYSACFLSALKVAGQQLKIKIPSDATVTATVGIGPRSDGGPVWLPASPSSCRTSNAMTPSGWSISPSGR